MLKWALVVFCLAIVAGALGFSGLAPAVGRVAKVLFFLSLPLLVALLILGLMAGEALF
jgi:uncharacterized membrane protein YtjA (UPF0391 family)